MLSVASAVDLAVTVACDAAYTAVMDGASTIAMSSSATGKVPGEDWIDTTPENEVWVDTTPSAIIPFVEQVAATTPNVWKSQ